MIFRAPTRLLLLLGLALVWLWPASAQSVDAGLETALQAALDAEYEAQIMNGLSAAVVLADGSVWTGASGFSDPVAEVPIRTDMRFGFASITKTYTAAVILQLAQEGVLSLDDPLSQWLPVMLYINSAITIRQLLGHTSGIYNFGNHPDLWAEVTRDLQHYWEPEETMATFLKPPVFFAGDGSGYSNSNYILLGMIIEEATGKEVATVFRERLLDPNGFDHTYLAAQEAPTGELAKTWWDYRGFGIWEDFSGFYQPSVTSIGFTTGSMYSTSEQTAQWAQALFAGNVLQPEWLEAMRAFEAISGTGDVWTGYGLGIQQFMIDGVELWGHSGLIRGSASRMVYSPAHGFSIAVVDNDGRSNHTNVVSALMAVLLDPTYTSVDAPAALPELVTVEAAYPNPFTDRLTVRYQLSEPAHVRLQVFNVLGQPVQTLHAAPMPSGTHRITWDGTDAQGRLLANGLYLYRLQAADELRTGTIVWHGSAR